LVTKMKNKIIALAMLTVLVATTTTALIALAQWPMIEVTKDADPTSIMLYGTGDPDTTTITITVTGYGGTIEDTIPIDIVFAIDSSGSMGWNDPSNLRLDAAEDFVDKLDSTRDQVGVVSWDDDIDFTWGLSYDHTEAKNQINNVDSSGGTTLDQGLAASIAMLDANTRTETSVEVILFLSDGEGGYTWSGTAGSYSDDAASKGYVIYTIGLTPTSGEAALQDIADATGGEYYSAPTAENLDDIFDEILTTIITYTAPYNVDVVEVTQSHIVGEGSFSITPDSVVEVGGETEITWLNVAQYIGDYDNRLDADETFVVTFEAGSSTAGPMIPVEVVGEAVVNYLDPDDATQTVDIPQAYLNVILPVYVDLKPASWPNPINVKDRGVISVAICGTADFDVMDIDPVTVELSREDGVGGSVPPLRWSWEDVATPYTGSDGGHDLAGDGIMDLVYKFKAQEVISVLELESLGDGDVIVLQLTGELFDGTDIIGYDYAWILIK
jgi:Ca-activated chloride channel family protein